MEPQEMLVIDVAADLLSEDGENLEYDRAVCEMTCRLLGLPTDVEMIEPVLQFRRGLKERSSEWERSVVKMFDENRGWEE